MDAMDVMGLSGEDDGVLFFIFDNYSIGKYRAAGNAT